ncbi:MAG: hypothetical protein WHS86_15940 [Desulfosoma sp.]
MSSSQDDRQLPPRRKRKSFLDLIRESTPPIVDALDQSKALLDQMMANEKSPQAGVSAHEKAGASADGKADESADGGRQAPLKAPAEAPLSAGASAHKKADRSADGKAGVSAHGKAGAAAYETADESAYGKAGQSADETAGSSAHGKAGGSSHVKAVASAYEKAGGSAYGTAGESAYEKAGQSADETAGAAAHGKAGAYILQMPSFTEKEALVYEILKKLGGRETSQDRIARAIGGSYSHVRKVISDLQKAGVLLGQKKVLRGRKVVSFSVVPVDYVCASADDVVAKIKRIKWDSLEVFPKIDRSFNKNLSICDESEEAAGGACEEFDPSLYPDLARIGFGPTQMRQIRQAWQKLGLALDGLPEALDRANWMARPENCVEIKNPLGYITMALKNGMPSPPPGYKSRQELVAEAMREKAEKIRQLQHQYFEDAFTVWWHELDESERRRIDAENRTRAMYDVHRREFFKRHVFKPLT